MCAREATERPRTAQEAIDMLEAISHHPAPAPALGDPSAARQWLSSGSVARLAAAIASDPSAATEPDDPVEIARYAVRWRLVASSCLARARSVRYLAECRRQALDAHV